MRNLFGRAFKPVLVLTMLVSLLVACAEPLSPEEAVRVRAQGWMDALLNGDLESAYDYTSPSYRQFATAGRYNARVEGAVGWDTGEVDTVECEGQVCQVRFIVEYEIKQMGVRNRRPLDYKWIQVEGDWWLYVPAK